MGSIARRTLATLIGLVVAAAATAGSPAAAATCVYPSSYPGDGAAKETLAAWLAGGARAAGVPGELPVMAALVDSGLRNLPQGDSLTAGYFQMRVDIWNKGDYAGFPDHPTLQLQWFIAQAQAARQRAIAAGDTTYGSDPSSWGAWAADVERPPEQLRGRYQLRLDDARSLMAAGCASPGTPESPSGPGASPTYPDAQLIPDSVLPRLAVQARRYQDAGRAGALALTAACSNESCLARAAATVAVPKRGIFRLAAAPVRLGRGERRTFRLALGRRLRALVSESIRKRTCPLAAVRVIAANAGGYRNSESRTVILGSTRTCS